VHGRAVAETGVPAAEPGKYSLHIAAADAVEAAAEQQAWPAGAVAGEARKTDQLREASVVQSAVAVVPAARTKAVNIFY
jgi:hypothetical protein